MDKILSIGLMSGTSRDGVDAAVMLTDGIEVGEFYGSLTIPYSSEAQIIIAVSYTHLRAHEKEADLV